MQKEERKRTRALYSSEGSVEEEGDGDQGKKEERRSGKRLKEKTEVTNGPCRYPKDTSVNEDRPVLQEATQEAVKALDQVLQAFSKDLETEGPAENGLSEEECIRDIDEDILFMDQQLSTIAEEDGDIAKVVKSQFEVADEVLNESDKTLIADVSLFDGDMTIDPLDFIQSEEPAPDRRQSYAIIEVKPGEFQIEEKDKLDSSVMSVCDSNIPDGHMDCAGPEGNHSENHVDVSSENNDSVAADQSNLSQMVADLVNDGTIIPAPSDNQGTSNQETSNQETPNQANGDASNPPEVQPINPDDPGTKKKIKVQLAGHEGNKLFKQKQQHNLSLTADITTKSVFHLIRSHWSKRNLLINTQSDVCVHLEGLRSLSCFVYLLVIQESLICCLYLLTTL